MGQVIALIDGHSHIRQFCLGELEMSQGGSELLTVVGIFECRVEGITGRTEHSPHDPIPCLIETGEGATQTHRRVLREHRGIGEANIIHGDLTLNGGAHGQFWFDDLGGETRCVGGDHETTHATPIAEFLSLCPDDRNIREARQADPPLGAVEDPVATRFLMGESLHGSRVGTRGGFSQPEATNRLPLGHPGQPLQFLVQGTMLMNRSHGQ